mgnify:CR=1 FL=1
MVKTHEHTHESTYTYECKHCGNEFPNENAAIKCEKSHSKKEIKDFEKKQKEHDEWAEREWNKEFNTGRDCS